MKIFILSLIISILVGFPFRACHATSNTNSSQNKSSHIVYFDKASNALKQRNYNKAIKYSKLAIQKIKDNKSQDSISREIYAKSLENLAFVYDKKNEAQKSYNIKKHLIVIKDSLMKEHYQSSIQAINHQHKLAQINAKQRIVKAENEAQSASLTKRKYLFILVSILLTIVVAFILMVLQSIQMRTRKKQKLQNKINARTQELSEMHSKLQIANRELEELAYISSRDLKKPLKKIRGLMNNIEQEKENMSTEAQYYLPYIVDGTKRLERLIDNLFSFSKLNDNKLPTEECNLNLLIKEALTHISRLFNERNTNIVYENLPVIYSNRQQLSVILKNLIENGIKYNQNPKPQINIKYDNTKEYHLIQISDNGIGIAPEHLRDVFKMFKRLHTQDEYEGTGLGLAICQKIAQSLGGHIFLNSTVNVGSTFTIQLPKTQIYV